MNVRLDQQIGGRFLDRGGAVLNVRHPDFGAVGDGAADDTAAIQAAVDAAAEAGGGRVYVPEGEYRVEGTVVLRAPYGLVLEGGGGQTTRIRGAGRASRAAAFRLMNRFSAVRDLSIHHAGYGVELGDPSSQGQSCAVENVWFRNCGTAIRGTNGNTNKVWSCFFESCDIGLHIAPDTRNGNGWTVYGTRAYGCATGYWLQGNAQHRFADDNLFIGVTAEAYSEYGFRVSGIRNIIDLYTETNRTRNPDAVDVWNESGATSNIFRYNAPGGGSRVRGVRNGLVNGVTPLEFRQRLVQYGSSVVELTSDKTDQYFHEGQLVEYRNHGKTRRVLLQDLHTRRVGGSQYYYFPADNTGPVTLVLDRPEGYVFAYTGRPQHVVPDGRAALLRLYKVSDRAFVLADAGAAPG